MGEKSVIVDNEDNPIGAKERSEIQLVDIYRVSALWIVNSKNQILISKRSANKKRTDIANITPSAGTRNPLTIRAIAPSNSSHGK